MEQTGWAIVVTHVDESWEMVMSCLNKGGGGASKCSAPRPGSTCFVSGSWWWFRTQCWQGCCCWAVGKSAKCSSSSLPRPLKWGPLGPSIGPLVSLQTKRFLAVDLCETYKNESKSGNFRDQGFYFILFLNFVILKIWQNLHPPKKKDKFTLGKTSFFFG
jgi:hypothetical protein